MKERKKTFKRRALAILMALVMAFGLAQTVAKPIDAYATGSVVASGDCGVQGDAVTWKLYEDGTLEISGNGPMDDFSNNVENYSPWKNYIDTITSVVICDGVTCIGNSAFSYHDKLTRITIGEDVMTIGEYAFYECESLTNITIGGKVATVGKNAFEKCTSLTNVYIEGSVTTISENTFLECNGLISVTLGDTVTTIGENAFKKCTSLTDISSLKNITTIGKDAFLECASLTSDIDLENVSTIGDEAFKGCSSLTKVTIGENVTTIGDWAFGECSSLTKVTIGENVTTIGDWAFGECSSLTKVTIVKNVTTIGNNAFRDCSSLTNVSFDDDSVCQTINDCAFYGCNNLQKISLPATVDSIGGDAFSNDVIVGVSSWKTLQGMAYCSDVTVLLEDDIVAGEGDDTLYLNAETVDFNYHIIDGRYLSSPAVEASCTIVGLTGDGSIIGNSVGVLFALDEMYQDASASFNIFDGNITIEADKYGIDIEPGYSWYGDVTVSNGGNLEVITTANDGVAINGGTLKCVDENDQDTTPLVYAGEDSGTAEVSSIADYVAAPTKYLNIKHPTTLTCKHPNTELSNAKEATCTEDGYSGDTICSDCGVEIEKGQVIPAGHNKKHVAAKASTCTKKGNSEYWSCDKCGKYFSDEELTTEIEKNSWILPLEDHNMTYHTAKEPDCTNAGNIEYWSCDKCGKCFSDKDGKTVISKSKSVIKAKGHTLIVRNKKDATKLSKGYTGDTYCSTCSRLISTGKEIDKLPDEVEKNKLVKTTKGSKYYKEDGSQAKNEWVTINGVPYYFNEDGYNASNEWRDGKWISSDGSCTYEGELVWKSNSTGWWIEDTAGWYPTNSWQKIDGVWYYFNASGYMASAEYYNGYWFNADGSWDENYYLTWRSNSTGWWVEDISGWWPSNQWLKIDGYWYYFDGSGYMVTNQYVGGFWIGADGTCR